MPDFISFQSAFQSLKTATELAKALINLNSTVERQGVVFDLQRVILETQEKVLSAQAEQTAFTERIHALEKEVAELKMWEAEKQRYQLYEPWQGCFVYALKESEKRNEPPHYLCQKCYEDGHKSILQDSTGLRICMDMLRCPRCNFEMERRVTSRAYV